MVVRDETEDLGQKLLALGFGHPIYTTAVQPTSKEGLPSGHGVRAHDRLELLAIVNTCGAIAGTAYLGFPKL